MKKIVSFLLTAVLLTAAVSVSSAAISVTGKTSEETSEIFPGVTSTHITTAKGTFYGLQDMRILEFDPRQEGLSVHVATGYTSLNTLSTVSNTVSRWAASHTDMAPIAAINGDWFTVSYDNYSTATSKRQLYIPLGFNMHDGEIVTSQQTSLESPSATALGDAPSFGIAADGTPLIGCISTTVRMQGASNITLDGINRLPSDNAIIMYTDRGPASNYCLDDAYEIYIDFDFDLVIKDGTSAIGTVTGISKPGEARQAMKENRVIVTARGTRIADVEKYAVGRKVRFLVSITDRYGNTDKWKTVTDCVGGHHMFALGGNYFNIGDATNYPANIIGIKSDGNVVFLCNDGRQGSDGYSVGVSISKMDDLAKELGVVSGIYMDGGGSTTMVQRNSSGSIQLVNRPCNNGHAQRQVSNAVILACDLPVTSDLTFDDPRYALLLGSCNNTTASLTDEGLQIMTTTAYDPFMNLVNLRFSASEYKYLVVNAKTTYKKNGGKQIIGLYLAAGATTGATEKCKARLELPESGEFEKIVVDLSDLALWTGDAHSIRIDTFDNFTGDEAGLGVVIKEIKFFKTLAEAEDFAKDPEGAVIGDLDGDMIITARDVITMKLALTGAVSSNPGFDLDGDGVITAHDLVTLKNLLAS